VNVDRQDDIAVLTMNEGKANAIGPEFLSGFGAALKELTAEPPRGLVVTGSGRHFCAGLDLWGLDALSEGEMGGFVADFERVFVQLFLLPFPVVAAVNGNAIAGGCVMACAADHRVGVTGNYKVGLNEARLGVSFPSIATEAPRCLLTPQAFRTALLRGDLMSPDEALSLGLLDELAAPETLPDRALAVVREFARSPREAFAGVKVEMRRPFVERVNGNGTVSRDRFVALWFSDEARERRRGALEK